MGGEDYSEKLKGIIHVCELVWQVKLLYHKFSHFVQILVVGPVLVCRICSSIVKFFSNKRTESSEEWLENGTKLDVDKLFSRGSWLVRLGICFDFGILLGNFLFCLF